jgi:hypothetical protein
MFGDDAHIYAYLLHLVYLNALNLSFVLYYHHVYERGRSGETMILSPVSIIRSSLVTFALFYFQYFKPKNHHKPCSLFPLVLASYWCLTTTTVSWGRKVVCSLL